MTLYSRYLKEREDFECIESDLGFATYKCQGHECYLRDIYVIPEQRKSRIAWDMADKVVEIAKSKGCTVLLGSVALNSKSPKASHDVLKAYGFKFLKELPNLIIYSKEI